ncbi:MAG: multidrug efflux MFS transporter [Chloroflexi bacterium]|nr:multidrug efflux MFS transporter [Chloroflexota bacterium]OJV95138.1 MAG: hypothetical protein BGO39_24290 [Chloroflexi bacterium 54-19]
MKKPSKYAIAFTAALGLFPVALDSTIVNVALIPISKALKTDFNTIQWIFIGYMLANAAVVSLSGYLGNRFGTKRMFLLGLALFTLFSALCGLAPDQNSLIALRVLQGIGGGMLFPLGMALAIGPFEVTERGKASALIGVPLMLAPVFGPILGGILIDNLAWQSIFFVNLPVGLVAFWLAWRVLPSDTVLHKSGGNFDYTGMALSTLGVVAVIYGVKLVSTTDPATVTALNPGGSIYGWSYWLVWVLLGVGAALLVAFGFNSVKLSKDPVMDLRLFKDYSFSMGILIVGLGSIVSFGVMSLIPQFLQQIRLPNLSAVDAGLALLPMGIGTVLGIFLGGGLYSRLGARPIAFVGAGVFAVGFWQTGHLSPTTSGGDIWFWLFLLGLGVTTTLVPAQTLAVGSLEGENLNKATSLINSLKLLVASVGASVLVTVLIQQTTSHAQTLSAGLAASGQVPTAAERQLLVAQAGSAGMNDLFTILTYMALGLMVVCLALPGRKKSPALKGKAVQAAALSEQTVAPEVVLTEGK